MGSLVTSEMKKDSKMINQRTRQRICAQACIKPRGQWGRENFHINGQRRKNETWQKYRHLKTASNVTHYAVECIVRHISHGKWNDSLTECSKTTNHDILELPKIYERISSFNSGDVVVNHNSTSRMLLFRENISYYNRISPTVYSSRELSLLILNELGGWTLWRSI